MIEDGLVWCRNLPFQMLNARPQYIKKEAKIIAQASAGASSHWLEVACFLKLPSTASLYDSTLSSERKHAASCQVA